MQLIQLHFRRETGFLGRPEVAVMALLETTDGWFLVNEDPTDEEMCLPEAFGLEEPTARGLLAQQTDEGWLCNEDDETIWDWIFAQPGVDDLGMLGNHPALAALYVDTVPAPACPA